MPLAISGMSSSCPSISRMTASWAASDVPGGMVVVTVNVPWSVSGTKLMPTNPAAMR